MDGGHEDDDGREITKVGGGHEDDDGREITKVLPPPLPGKLSTEEGFKNTEVPSWGNQITVRAVVASGILSVVFIFIVCKLNLTTGVIPSLNVAAGLLGFAMLKGYTSLLDKFGMLKQPFTRQENTVIQTCVVASSGIAFSSGTASYILGMSGRVAAQADAGNMASNVKSLSVSWIIPYLFLVSFVGLFSIVTLRKLMIMEYKLTYPSGTATAHLINSLHTPKGAKLAKKQVMKLYQSFSFSFAFAFFQWFFAAADGCGFGSFPTFGLKAYAHKFYFDFSTTYVGVGMITSPLVNLSLLFGAILSWGIMWPTIETKKGIWYSAKLSASSLHGLQGYKVFLAIAMMLGDGLFHVVFMLAKTLHSLYKQHHSSSKSQNSDNNNDKALSEDEKKRSHYFLKDQIPVKIAIPGYIILSLCCIIFLPQIFPQLKWYHILVAYIIAPILAFCNAYGCGLTDWSLASSYGKIAILIFSAWVGLDHGGVLAGLASCGLMMSIVSTAADLMQDFKTGYLTLASPRSMFFSQVIGTAMGCIMSPLVFWVFYKAYSVGDPTGSYPAPYGLMYRGIALLGVEGFSSLPKHCLQLSICFFIAGISVNVIKSCLEKYEKRYKIHRFIPLPMAMAIPFYLGAYFAISMCIGTGIVWVWRRKNKKAADDYSAAVASGLICGESLWGIPASVLSLAGIKAPICMKFLSASDNDRVDGFLGN